jgi:hypothetical protein
MDTQVTHSIPDPSLYEVSPYFSDAVNRNIIQSEIEGGVFLNDLLPGMVLSIQTQSRVYELSFLHDNVALISGHPEICPEAVEVHIQGSTWGGSMIKMRFIGRGMCLEYIHPVLKRCRTSPIADIRIHGHAADTRR